jgi:hypothetical protein
VAVSRLEARAAVAKIVITRLIIVLLHQVKLSAMRARSTARKPSLPMTKR